MFSSRLLFCLHHHTCCCCGKIYLLVLMSLEVSLVQLEASWFPRTMFGFAEGGERSPQHHRVSLVSCSSGDEARPKQKLQVFLILLRAVSLLNLTWMLWFVQRLHRYLHFQHILAMQVLFCVISTGWIVGVELRRPSSHLNNKYLWGNLNNVILLWQNIIWRIEWKRVCRCRGDRLVLGELIVLNIYIVSLLLIKSDLGWIIKLLVIYSRLPAELKKINSLSSIWSPRNWSLTLSN